MTIAETRYMQVVPSALADIVRELKIANELKALELKLNHPDSAGMIDRIIEENR